MYMLNVGMAMLSMEIIIGWKYGWVEAPRQTGADHNVLVMELEEVVMS